MARDGMGFHAWQGNEGPHVPDKESQIGTNGLGSGGGPIRVRGLGCASAVDIYCFRRCWYLQYRPLQY